MADISSPTLVDETPLPDLSQIMDDVDASKPKGELQDFAETWNKEETAKVSAAARWSRQYDPDQYAKAAKLGLGLDPEVGIRQMELLDNKASIAAYGDVFNRAPQLRGYFAERPKELAKANPDELDNLSGISWATQAVPAALQSAYTSIEAGRAAKRISLGKGTIYDKAFLANYQDNRTFGADGYLSQALVYTAQSTPYLFETTKGAMRGSVLFGATGAVGGTAVAPGPGTLAGALTGALYGSIAGGYLENRELQANQDLLKFMNMRSEDGKTIDPTVAYYASRITGSISAMLDMVGMGPVLKVFPGSQAFLEQIRGKGMEVALKTPLFRDALYRLGTNVAEQTGTEVGTEVLQQGVSILGGELAKANSQGKWDYMSPEEIAQEMASAGLQALQVMTLIAPLASSTRFGRDLVEINASKRGHDTLNQVINKIDGNKLLERDPQLASDLIDRQTNNQKLYIPSQELVQLFQEQGLDRYGPPLPNWRQRLDEALAMGSDVEVSVGEFVSHLGKNPKDNPLLDLVKTDPTGYTRQEIQQYSEVMDQLLLSEAELAQKKGQMPSERLTAQVEQAFPEIEDLKKQIQAIGFQQKAVDSYTTMFNAFFQTLAQKTGRTPSDLFNEYGVEVQRGLLGAVQQTPQDNTIFADKLGRITLAPEGQKSTIELFDGHDMSTLLHESGHFFLDTMQKVKKAAPSLIEDWATIEKHLGIEGDKITTEQHEKFAKMAEAYFREGKAPEPKLRPIFEQFRGWLKAIYKNIRALGGKVDPEIAKVFDRMFATDERINAVALDTAYAPIFQTAEEMGLSPEEYLKYSNLVDKLRHEGQDAARERIQGQTARQAKGWQGEIQKQLQKEAEAKLAEQAPYSHIPELKSGRIKIDREAFEKKYSKEAANKFPREAFAKDGLDPDLVAELLDYPTADDMVYDFTQASPLKEAAKELAQQEMEQRYGEDFNNSGIVDLAVKEEMSQEARLTVLGTELKALSRKNGVETTDFGPKQAAKKLARDSVYARKFGDLSSGKAQAAVTHAASMKQASILKGDWAQAADWARKQLIAQALANEVTAAIKAGNKIRDKAARYSRTSSKTIAPAYMEQIRALVEKYSFAKISGRALGQIQNLRSFLDGIEAEGQVTLQIPDRLLRDAGKVSYKELSVEDLLGLGDTLTNLEHLGRTADKIFKNGQAEVFAAKKNDILTALSVLKKREKKMKTYTQEERGLMDRAIAFHASLLKPEQVIEFLDSGDIKGPMMEYVFQPITDALNAQNELSAEYNKKIMDIFEDIPANHLMEEISIPSQERKFTREEIYATALNTGNESSRKKLLEGELWSEAQLNDILAHMDKPDWDRVQKVWDVLEDLWPKIAALEKRLTGVAPKREEARAFSTMHGDYKGGYYPVVYDFKTRRGVALIKDVTPVDKQFANGLFSNEFTRPGTNHKYTVKRTRTAKPINLSLGVLPAHVQTVIHDLTHREAIRSAYKILWDPEIQRAIEDVEGHEVYKNLQEWLKSVATERHNDQDATAKIVSKIRTGLTIYGLGYRLSTVMAQGLGLFPALTRVNKSSMINAIGQLAKHPQKTWDFISENSVEMRHRMNQQDRDIRQAVTDITRKRNPLDWFKLHAFTWIGYLDRGVSSAVWLSAYGEYIQAHPSERDLAIRSADRAVRLTQGTGNVKDMAQIMNSKSELNRLFTMFYSGFSAQYNLQVDLTRKTRRDIEAGDWRTVALQRLPQWMYLVVIPAILGAWITGDTPDKDESVGWWASRKALLYPMASVPFVRDIAGAIDTGFDYKMSPISRVGDSSVKALRELFKMTDEDKEFDMRKFIKPAAEVGSIALGLPTGQAISTIDNLWQGLEKRDLKAKDLFFRRNRP
jgi:hypothetical protein